MKTLYQAFATVKQYETDGIVLDFGPSQFRVRRSGGSNRKYLSALQAKMRPHKQALAAGTLPEDKSKELLVEVFFETVVIDWYNVTDRSGAPLAYTLENFKMLMSDLPDLWSTLMVECDNIKNFQEEEIKQDGEALGKS